MRRTSQILERCEYLRTSDATAGHGFKGWLGVTSADATLALRDLEDPHHREGRRLHRGARASSATSPSCSAS